MALLQIAQLLLTLCAAAAHITPGPVPSRTASASAGSTVTAVFPPPNAMDTSVNTFFPDASIVGHGGPTPTGDQPWLIETAPVAPKKEDVYPLVGPIEAHGQGRNSSSFNPIRSWANLSPWWSLGGYWGLPEASSSIPAGCELTQVHLLHRHGARYPTSGPNTFAQKINAAATSGGFVVSGPLGFLSTWTYKLGAEILTAFGQQQLFDLGVTFRVKYGHLLSDFTDLPVFRTLSGARMVDSALNFAAGFFGVQQYRQSYHQLIMIEEDAGFFNALAPWAACEHANDDTLNIATEAALNWTVAFFNSRGTVKRLQKFIKGVDLDVTDVRSMQNLCAYETVALGYSSFCDLFTEDEWRAYEYAVDLEVWYGYGPGSPTAAAQGIGYVQELVARLTETPITDFVPSLNRTLEGNNVTFPVNQPIYVDASHDTVISTILVALNFTSMAATGPLPVDHIPKNHIYRTSHVIPFSTNLVGQVMSCPAVAKGAQLGSKEAFIRFLVNDGVVPLTGISHCTENRNGLCRVQDFVAGMKERIAEVDFEYDCSANYTVPWPDPIVDGRMRH